MVAKPVLSVLMPLLQDCLRSGTKAHEDGLTVSIERGKDEEIYFFHIDCDEGSRCLGMNKTEKEKCCDYLVFYAKEKSINEVFCFLELKGKNVQRAMLQVISAYTYVLALLRKKPGQIQLQDPVWSVYICLSGSVPQENKKVQKELKKRFGEGRVSIKAVVEKDTTEFPRFLRKLG